MSRFQALGDFERRFETMDVNELRQWKKYWTHHAQQLAPKVRKQAMKRVYDIDKAIERRLSRMQSKGLPNEVTSAEGAGPLRFAFVALRGAPAELLR